MNSLHYNPLLMYFWKIVNWHILKTPLKIKYITNLYTWVKVRHIQKYSRAALCAQILHLSLHAYGMFLAAPSSSIHRIKYLQFPLQTAIAH